MYNYIEEMKSDILDYIAENVNASEYADRDELDAFLNDELWTVDSVTGNGSGSYTFNRWQAREYVLDNLDILAETQSEFGMDYSEVGKKFLNEEWEYFDVTIRCYLLGQAISEALDEIEDTLTFSEDEDAI